MPRVACLSCKSTSPRKKYCQIEYTVANTKKRRGCETGQCLGLVESDVVHVEQRRVTRLTLARVLRPAPCRSWAGAWDARCDRPWQ